MTSRRNFIRDLSLTSLAIPFGEKLLKKEYHLNRIDPSLFNSDEDYWKAIRLQFPLKADQTYFNNGTIGPMPGYVMNAVMNHMQHYAVHGAEIDYKGNGQELLNGYFPYVELRTKMGDIINCDYKELSIIQNATFGMNIVAHGLDLKAGDEIINTNQEHGGGFGAWQLLAKRKGCVYKQATMPVPANDPEEIVEAIMQEVTDKTKVIAVPHIISVYGVVMPCKRICEEAHKRGIFVILDGAQSVGQTIVDVKNIGCDAFYSSLHKWLLAPAGSGILYINKDKVKNIWTTMASYNWDHPDDPGFRLMQYGTGNPAITAGQEAAVDFYNTIGAERWTGRIKELGDYLREGLESIDKVTIHSS
ncbi:MAG: aminotransferase class V-fold PLP-dependent enzyme, partial [Bacteroidia bacterium]|nr:aminotransferase class V-fold PLP-dependent enzyme [Bacteroidia bacterium]